MDEGDDATGGNPFAGMGPFGTGIDDNSQFEDAELSETGRVRAPFQTPDSRFRPY